MRLWVQPTGFVPAPQLAGDGALRLAGGLQWFTALALTLDNGGRRERRFMSVRELDAALAELPADAVGQLTSRVAALTAPRPPLILGERSIPLDQPRVVGIVNVTPDSFSDGGRHFDPAVAIDAGVAMTAAGAAFVDVGGESTRPGARLVWEGDERDRVLPVVQGLARAGLAVSIDSRKASVLEQAIAAGAGLANDISALGFDDRSAEVVARTGVPVVLMHAPSQGSDPHQGGTYGDVVTEVFDWLERRVEEAVAFGIERARIIVDPGIGFGKSLAENLALLNALPLFHGLDCPLLVGVSRKRMIGALSGEAAADQRLGGSVALATLAAEAGAQLIRVHDVPETVQALATWRGLRDAALTMRD